MTTTAATTTDEPRARRRSLPFVGDPLALPTGWFSLGLARSLRPRAVRPERFFGRDLVLFRTAAGRVGLLDAHCPHLGAHLGVGGTVVGEAIRCPFHGFRFGAEGACDATGYGTRVPPGLRVGAWPVIERHGVLLAWHDAAGGAPTWDVPELDMEGWSPFRLHAWRLRGHPQETTENSVDLGHFGPVHGYDEARECAAPEVDGPVLRTRYRFARRLGGRRSPVVLREDITIHVHGLGYSRVEVTDLGSGLRFRLLVLPTCEDDGYVRLRIGLSVRDPARTEGAHPILRLVPAALSRGVIAPLVLRFYAREVSQDFRVWEAKRYVPRPALAAGDGPIGLYRRWVRQFYP